MVNKKSCYWIVAYCIGMGVIVHVISDFSGRVSMGLLFDLNFPMAAFISVK